MRFQREWLRSKVAKRILVLFLLCAVVPTAALAWLTYRELNEELARDAERRLRQASKAVGLDLLSRLNDLDAALRALELHLASGERTVPDHLTQNLARYFEAVAVWHQGNERVLLGDSISLPDFNAPDLLVQPGKPVLVTGPGEGPTAEVTLARQTRDGRVIAGRARRDVLVPSFHKKAIAFASNFCVFDADARLVGCSFPEGERGSPPLPEASSLLDSGGFRWESAGERFFANGWALFLRAAFGAPEWTVVVVEPEAAVLAPLHAFARSYPPLAGLALALATLLSLTQIRRSLVPLDELRRATRRIGDNQLDFALEIRSGDEFEDLASSFNQMTARLRSHFDSLQRLIHIDRSILAEHDAQRVLETALARVGELFPCDIAVLALEEPEAVQLYFKRGGAAIKRSELRLAPGNRIGDWFSALEPVEYEAGSAALPYHAHLSQFGVARWVALPLVVEEKAQALMLLGTNAPEAADQILFAQQLADQSAVALANARTHEKNRALAYFDRLTELPNRLLFGERAGQAIQRGRRDSRRIAVIALDLDHFKRINDTAGHESGDWFLKRLAARIRREAEPHTLARMGADEFAVLVEPIDSADDAARVAGRLLQAIEQPQPLGTHTVTPTASAGIAIFPDDGADLDNLMKNADAALYHAKNAGRNRYQFYAPEMNEAAAAHLALESELRAGLARGELRVFYQPTLRIADRRVVGAEALVRWQHPQRGLVSPGEFIPLAERSGLTCALGEFVLREACQQVATWQRERGYALRISVNLSVRQLGEANLPELVSAACRDARLDPSSLALELVESMLVDSRKETLRTLRSLKTGGCEIYIDDFGTGYSCLAYLRDLPVDCLKIDRSFIMRLGAEPAARAIPEAVIAMARGLGLRSIAEGVETEEQLAMVTALGCAEAQGFLFSPPIPPDEFEKWMEDHEFG